MPTFFPSRYPFRSLTVVITALTLSLANAPLAAVQTSPATVSDNNNSTTPDLELWTQRGNAALAGNDATAGQEAGEQLIKLGGLTKNSESTAHLTLAKLVLKGWIKLPSPIPPPRKAPRKGKVKPQAAPESNPAAAPLPEPAPDYDDAAKTVVSLISKAYGQNYEASNRRQQVYLYPRYNKDTRELTFQLRSQRVDKYDRILIERANITIPVPLITRLDATKNRWGNGLRIDTLPDQIQSQPVTASKPKKIDTTSSESTPASGTPLSTLTIFFSPRPESPPSSPNQHLIDIQALTNALVILRGAPATK